MTKEIEAKFKVESLKEVESQLKVIGADFRESLIQRDCYYTDPSMMMLKKGCGLRIRRQKSVEKEKVLITFKGPKTKSKFKQRKEVEVEVADFEAMSTILEELGYQKKLIIEKKRDMWYLDDCYICLDELPLLGSFVEIEGPDTEQISFVAEKLKLSHLTHINKGYSKLIIKKLKELGSSQTEVLFTGA